MELKLEDILSFEDRKNRMQNIRRFNSHKNVKYRLNLWDHQNILLCSLDNFLDRTRNVDIFSNLDYDKLKLMHAIHDDLEIVSGVDVSTYEKESMDKNYRRFIEKTEICLLYDDALQWFGDKRAVEYFKLVTECNDKKTIESQLVSYLDKFQGKFEAIHNAIAGSSDFLQIDGCEGIVDRYFRINGDLINKLDKLKPFFENIHPLNFLHKSSIEIDMMRFLYLKNKTNYKTNHPQKLIGISCYDFFMSSILKFERGKEISKLLFN